MNMNCVKWADIVLLSSNGAKKGRQTPGSTIEGLDCSARRLTRPAGGMSARLKCTNRLNKQT